MQGFANSIAGVGMVGPCRNLSLAIEAFRLADHGVVIHRCYLIEIDGMQHPQVFHPVAGFSLLSITAASQHRNGLNV